MPPPWAPPWLPLVRALSISIFPSPSPPPDNIMSGAMPESPPPNNPPPAPPEPRLLSCDSISRFLAAFCAADCPAIIKWSIPVFMTYFLLAWVTSCFMKYTSCFYDILSADMTYSFLLTWHISLGFFFKTYFLPLRHTSIYERFRPLFSLIPKQILGLNLYRLISRETEQDFFDM